MSRHGLCRGWTSGQAQHGSRMGAQGERTGRHSRAADGQPGAWRLMPGPKPHGCHQDPTTTALTSVRELVVHAQHAIAGDDAGDGARDALHALLERLLVAAGGGQARETRWQGEDGMRAVVQLAGAGSGSSSARSTGTAHAARAQQQAGSANAGRPASATGSGRHCTTARSTGGIGAAWQQQPAAGAACCLL